MSNNLNVKRNFTKVPNVIIKEGKFDHYEVAVLVYILSFDECYAGQATIAKALKTSRSSVQRALTRLLERNVVSKKARTGWSCVYQVNPRNQWKELA